MKPSRGHAKAPYSAKVRDGQTVVHLGWFATKEERAQAQERYKSENGIDNSHSARSLRGWQTRRMIGNDQPRRVNGRFAPRDVPR